MNFIPRVAALGAAVLLAVAPAPTRHIEGVKKDGKPIVATERQFAAFNYFQGAKLTGFEVDVEVVEGVKAVVAVVAVVA